MMKTSNGVYTILLYRGEEVRKQVKEAFLTMGSTQAGKVLLARIPIQQIGQAEMADYAPIGKLGLEALYQE